MTQPALQSPATALDEALKRIWGYDRYRPLQREAMEHVLQQRDSIVVLPTGGGKSLCFQVPAVTMPGVAVVVSPLVSLMKDQVDALNECGVAAARIDSSQSPAEREDAFVRLRRGELQLIYLSPERLMTDFYLELLRTMPVSMVAIDEAHCISMWGHDFRPEYTQLGRLRAILPGVALHAYTATATAQVRADIARQLTLRDPAVLVGSFDRPNLVYRTRRRLDAEAEVARIVARHPGESGIVYCLRRADVEKMCAALAARGVRVAPYHAGLEAEQRQAHQEAFIRERIEVIVATVAFGMGIDKPNVRYVVHSGMPRSLEHYQQESGRAGRDGLQAECILLYSGADFGFWKYMTRDLTPEAAKIAMTKVNSIYEYATSTACRHRTLLAYFGQHLEKQNCAACDSCFGGLKPLPAAEAQTTAQMILSSIVRQGEAHGASYTAAVLQGREDHSVQANGHRTLTTFGLLRETPLDQILGFIEQLADQGALRREEAGGVLQVTPHGWRILRAQAAARLLRPVELTAAEEESAAQETAAATGARPERAVDDGWDGVDRPLFDKLKRLRSDLAESKGIPAYVVFGDATLRAMAREKPVDRAGFRALHGVGDRKCKQYCDMFLPIVRHHLKESAA